jgi:hypothetical protein
MALSGHKTSSEDDLRDALARTQASLLARAPGTVVPLRGAADGG